MSEVASPAVIKEWIINDIQQNDVDDLFYVFERYPESINLPLDSSGNPFVTYCALADKPHLAFLAIDKWNPDLKILNKNGLSGVNAIQPFAVDEESMKKAEALYSELNIRLVASKISEHFSEEAKEESINPSPASKF